MRSVFSLLAGLWLSSCQSLSGISYPSDFHQYEELRSFKAPPVEDIDGQSYRLTWHAWHKTPGLILANCNGSDCFIEVRFTDGYGTYSQGDLAGIRKAEISRNEFEEIDLAFRVGGFYELKPQLRAAEQYHGLKASENEGELVICLHAPSYYLEAFDGSKKHMIYRYCQDNYDDGLRVAMPLIELAERNFPNEMKSIVAVWIEDERLAEEAVN